MFLPQTLILSSFTQLPYPYGKTQKSTALIWNVCVGNYTHVDMFQNETIVWFQAQWLNPSFPPMSDVSQLHFWPIFQPISRQLCLSFIALSSSSSPLSVSISEFNKQTDVLESSFKKDVTFTTSFCLSSNHSLLLYCVLEVDNLWSSSWGICISVLFFWSIFLLQRHGTLM